MYKLSTFSVEHDLADQGAAGQVLVFNTLSGQCVLLEDSAWQRVRASLPRPAEAEEDVTEAIERLARGGIVVATDLDERRAYEDTFDRRRYDTTAIFPIFAVTTACNIGCTYCYEEGVEGQTMSEEVVAGVLRWVERRVAGDGVRRVTPSLFGGEPLLHPELLFALMDGVAAICDRHGARYAFTSSSNGMLLTDDLAAALAARGLQQIQISLDGPARTHDERRVGKRGQPSFDAALRGIRIAAEHVPMVTVKVNFDRHNRAAVAELYDQLAAEGLAGRVDVKLEAVALQIGSGTVHDPAMVIPPEAPELADAYLELMLEARRRGITVNRETAHTTPCMFSADHGVIIGPDGSIHKCISLVGRAEHRVGTVFDDGYDAEAYASQMDTVKRTEECWEERCPYIPVCAGGCAYESIVRTGRHDLRFCTKEHLERWHYRRYLYKYEDRLEARGIAPLTVEQLRASAATGAPAASGTGCGAGCGPAPAAPAAPAAASLLRIGRSPTLAARAGGDGSDGRG